MDRIDINRIKNGSRFRFSLKVPIEVRWPPPNLWSDLRGTQVSTMTDGGSQVTELVCSIYTRRERDPEAEELLLCSRRTTLEVPGFADLGMGQASRRLALCLENLEHVVKLVP